MRQICLWGRLLLGIAVVGTLMGCADFGRLGAKMHGLKVVAADDCRHFLHTTPCKTVESTP